MSAVRFRPDKQCIRTVFVTFALALQTFTALAQSGTPASVSEANLGILSRATRAEAYSIRTPAPGGPQDLSHSTNVFLRALSDREFIEFRGRIEAIIQSAGLRPQSSCRFAPEFGIAFAAGSETVWWILDSHCSHSGMLVAKSEDWGSTAPLLLPKDVMRAFLLLRAKRKESKGGKPE